MYHRKSSFVWLGVAIREAGLVDSMRVTEGSRIAGRLNLVGFLDSTCITAPIIVYLHCVISVSQSPITKLESNILLFGWLFKLCSNDFRNIGSLNNVTP